MATTQYDGVYGIPNGYYGPSYVVPLLETLPDAQENNETLCHTLAKYGISDQGPNHMYHMDDDPTLERINEAISDIKSRLSLHPNQNFLITFVVTGRGVTDMGKQALLLNEFNEKSGYYNHWSAEEDILNIAKEFSNAYVLAFFCCNRDVWISSRIYDGFGGCDHPAANMHFRYKMDKQTKEDREM